MRLTATPLLVLSTTMKHPHRFFDTLMNLCFVSSGSLIFQGESQSESAAVPRSDYPLPFELKKTFDT